MLFSLHMRLLLTHERVSVFRLILVQPANTAVSPCSSSLRKFSPWRRGARRNGGIRRLILVAKLAWQARKMEGLGGN